MRARALENLRAADVLVAVDPPCANAAVSRAYYAVYQACCFLLEEQGDEPPEYDGRRYWRHDDFPLYLFRATIIDDDGREFVEHLYSKRVQADYYPDEVGEEEARHLTREARTFLEALGVER